MTGARWPYLLSLPLAALVAVAALGGIFLPATYARETASWAAQGMGQDWVDLVVVAPLLAVSAAGSSRGSRAWRLVLGGALLYTAYSFVLYAFFVHVNALFLVYCAALGLSVFALAGVVGGALADEPRGWFAQPPPVRLAGGLLVAVAALFAALWLAELLPALARGEAPASVAEVGAFTNPVHVLDLSLALPAMVVGGVALLRRRPLGYVLGPMLLVFNVLMPLAITGMVLSMRARGLPAGLAPLAVFSVVVPLSAASAVRVLRRLRVEGEGAGRGLAGSPPSA